MLVDVFASSPGSVAVFQPGGAAPMTLAIEGFTRNGSAYNTVRSIVTSVGLKQEGNYQFTHTLKSMVYVYTFGERVGDMRVDGLCFLNPCQGRSGLESVHGYYDAYRLSSRGTPVAVAIGSGVVFRALLISLELIVADPLNSIGQFAFGFKYVSRVDRAADALAGVGFGVGVRFPRRQQSVNEAAGGDWGDVPIFDPSKLVASQDPLGLPTFVGPPSPGASPIFDPTGLVPSPNLLGLPSFTGP